MSENERKFWKQVKKIAKNALRSELKAEKHGKKNLFASEVAINDAAAKVLRKSADFIDGGLPA